jgi:large subunit ribosomal protein L25
MSILELQTREPSAKSATRMRRGKLVPGVIYGDQIRSRHFSITRNKAEKLLKESSNTGLLEVQIAEEKEPVKAIMQEVQRDSVSGTILHIDLYQVRMDKKLHTDIFVVYTGESSAVKDLGGTLVKQFDQIPIECLPADLISSIEVSIGSLKSFSDVIRVSDLAFPEGVATTLPNEEIIASVAEPRTDEEMAELDAEIKAEDEGPEVLTAKDEAEEGEVAEGEANAEASEGAPSPEARAEDAPQAKKE